MHPSKELGGECPLLCGRAREHRAVVQLRRRTGAKKLDARQHLGRARRLPNLVGGEHGDMHRVRIGYDALGLHRVEEGERPPVFAAALASRDRGRVLHPAGHHVRVGAQLFPHRERLCVPSQPHGANKRVLVCLAVCRHTSLAHPLVQGQRLHGPPDVSAARNRHIVGCGVRLLA